MREINRSEGIYLLDGPCTYLDGPAAGSREVDTILTLPSCITLYFESCFYILIQEQPPCMSVTMSVEAFRSAALWYLGHIAASARTMDATDVTADCFTVTVVVN